MILQSTILGAWDGRDASYQPSVEEAFKALLDFGHRKLGRPRRVLFLYDAHFIFGDKPVFKEEKR